MDGTNKESSPAPPNSAPSSKGFKGVIAKARLGRKDDISTTSLNGSDECERGGLRSSVDSLIDRARDSGRTSADDALPPGPSNLSKLIPGRVKKKRKKREEAEQLQHELAEGRGRSADDQTATAAGSSLQPGNGSRTTLGEDGGSLLTVESDTESPVVSPSRPPVLSHPSHIDYLTSSSPLFKTKAPADAPSSLQLDGPTFQNPQYQKAKTFPPTDSTQSSASDLAPQHAATMDTREGGRSLSAVDGNRSRGVSPGAKIKDVFTMGSKRKDVSPPKSPDRASAKSTDGNALGSLFKKDKWGSVSLGRPSKASESVQSFESNPKSPTTSMRDIPTIVTAPSTPPSASFEAPETHVTPPTPTDAPPASPNSPSFNNKAFSSAGTNANTITSPSGNMISHRRVRSDSATQPPSKLSNVMSAPLTPTIEEGKTPGARTPGAQGLPGGGGFFSSVFSAAQNAANQLSNTIANNNQPRSRSSTQEVVMEEKQDLNGAMGTVAEADDRPISQEKKSAIDTLGMGDLNLSHLGIGTGSPQNNSTTTLLNGASENGDNGNLVLREEAAARAEDVSAARAVSAAYTEKSIQDNTYTPVAEDLAPVMTPRSTYEASIMTGEKTPPNGSLYEGNQGIRRSGSVRSRVEKITKRHRNSSSATGGTIGAAIASGNAAIANPTSSGGTPKLTGFAVATKKRNREFHNLFRTVPEDDYLIEDYSCALQRDIILAGRIYISEGHICFSSNILGWVTTLIISFDEIVSVEKESTAMVFPNAIAIQTLHARHTFRSLLSREATYDLIIGIWKVNHPSLKSSLNGVRLDQGGTGDKTEKADPSGSDGASDTTEDEEEIYDEDEEEDEGTGSFTEVPEGSIAGSELVPDQQPTRKASAMGIAAGAAASTGPTVSEAKGSERAAAASSASQDFPGPATHAPTECSDGDTHLDKFLKDDIIPAPLGKVYSMVFGPASGGFMAKWLLDEIKVTDLQLEDAKKALSEENKTRNFSYIKPLYASIGPKSTKCVVTDNLDSMDYEKAICVTQSTQTPDVPSGNVFVTKTHFCFMWAPGNATRIIIHFTIEWTGKSWLKGPIEKGAADGQTTYCNDLVKALKAGVTSRPRAGTIGSKPKGKGKRKKGDTSPSIKSPVSEKATPRTQAQDPSWGLFKPLHGILGPVIDIFSPFISANMVIGFLLFVILFNYLRGPKAALSNSLTYPGMMPSSQRIAAYEEIWRREESDLWDWLEERVGMQGVSYPSSGDREAIAKARKAREKSLKGQGKALRNVKMSEREVDEAIRVTEERLGVLKRAVQEGKEAQGNSEEGSGEKAAMDGVGDGGGEIEL